MMVLIQPEAATPTNSVQAGTFCPVLLLMCKQ
jgi:hypothetical protein